MPRSSHASLSAFRLAGVCLAALLLSAVTAWPEAPEEEGQASLRDLPGIEVVVEELSPDVMEAGLRMVDLEEEVKERIRKTGLPLLGRQDRLKTGPAAALVVRVNTLHDRIGRYFLCVELELRQRIRLVREDDSPLTGTTWTAPTLITVVPDDNVKQVREIVGRRADRFAKAYAAANAK